MAEYAFTGEADADLDGIVGYTRREWDDGQTRGYLAQLSQSLDQIADDSAGHKIVTTLARPVHVLRCQHHYIYCLPRDQKPALIIAILHERTDLIARIAERLG